MADNAAGTSLEKSRTIKKQGWKTKDILVAGMVAVVFALVQVGATYAFMGLTATAGPVFARLLNGVWFISGFMALAIIRKPGIGFVAQAIAGIVMIPLTPFGVLITIGTLINGVLTELIFLLTRYKNYSAAFMIVGTAVLSVAYTLFEYSSAGYGGLSVAVQVGILAASAIGGGVCGWLCRRITDSLLKTGLLSGYAHARS